LAASAAETTAAAEAGDAGVTGSGVPGPAVWLGLLVVVAGLALGLRPGRPPATPARTPRDDPGDAAR
ncbi:MFS transporter, partial [Streptomyces sp. NPDC041003]